MLVTAGTTKDGGAQMFENFNEIAPGIVGLMLLATIVLALYWTAWQR